MYKQHIIISNYIKKKIQDTTGINQCSFFKRSVIQKFFNQIDMA